MIAELHYLLAECLQLINDGLSVHYATSIVSVACYSDQIALLLILIDLRFTRISWIVCGSEVEVERPTRGIKPITGHLRLLAFSIRFILLLWMQASSDLWTVRKLH